MKRLRRVALAVAGVVLAGAAAAVGIASLVAAHPDRLLGALGKALGREVRVQRVGLTLRGGIGVALSGVDIADDPAAGRPEPLVSARTFDLRLRILPLLRRRLVVDRIVVDAPVLRLVRERSGRLNVEGLRRPADEGRAEAPGAGPSHPPSFQLASLRLRHGVVRYEDAASGRSIELTDVAADARQPRFEAPIPVSLRARLVTRDLRVDDIVSEGVLDLTRGSAVYQGSLSAGASAIGPIAVDRASATVRAAPPNLDLDPATLTTLGGSVAGAAHLTSENGRPALAARLEAHGIDLARLPARPNRPRPAGTLALRAAVAGPPPGAPGFGTGATGDGRFDVADGRIEGAGFGRPVLEALQPFLKPGVADRLRARYPDLLGSDDLRFTTLSGSGRLAGGRVRSDDLVLAAPSYEARGEGSLGLDGDVDATLRLAASPALTDDILGQSQARTVLVDARGQLTIPLRVRGPVGRPHVSPDPAFAATAARAVLGRSSLGDLADDVVQRLLGGKRRRER